MRIKINQILDTQNLLGKEITVCGWIKSLRHQKSFSFIEINDGSSLKNLQIILDNQLLTEKMLSQLTTGSSIAVDGMVQKSPGKNQTLELHAKKVLIFGFCPSEDYPLQKKRHTFEFLRDIAHLRPRTNTQGAVSRIRNALAFATHKFFQEKNFLWIPTPIITGEDCEGAGELFQTTTLKMPFPTKADGSIDYSEDFFAKPTYLTVSGQLNGEAYACALSDIYTFGPTFRAENSHTPRHLAEFWMIEPEIAFATLQDDIHLAEDFLKYVIQNIFDTCSKDMIFFDSFIEKGLIDRLHHVLDKPFEQISYTDAISILEKASKKFAYPVSWGLDLQTEHERYLTEEHFKNPVVVTDYPENIKAFYMRNNDDEKTVAAMDVLVPKIGEIIGGSQREERFHVLDQKMEKFGLNKKNYQWYLDLRKYGTIPHAGFGVGFERLLQFLTGMENIRDVTPFPRVPKNANF